MTIDSRTKYETVTTWPQLNRWIDKAMRAGVVAVDTETDTVIATQAKLAGISLSTQSGEGCYIPVGHETGEDQLPLLEVLEKLKPLLVHPLVTKVLHNAKYDLVVFRSYGVEVSPIEDTMLMSYAQWGGKHRHGMDELAHTYLGHTTIKFVEVAGSGQSQIPFKEVDFKPATAYAAEDADVTMAFFERFYPSLLEDERSHEVYEQIDKPLIPIIQAMEEEGVLVDTAYLQQLTTKFQAEMDRLLVEAYLTAGTEFNPASPQQVGAVLKAAGVDTGKLTASGQMSTDAKLLVQIASADNLTPRGKKLIDVILEWRQYAKLVGTYTEALQEQVNPRTGRIHTSYGLASTITGRLASSDPNLQNIPIRTDEGKMIRAAFVAKPGYKIISADYSQIELRLAAYASQDHAMLKAFADGHDIHKAMAAKFFGKELDAVTSDERRDVKEINFGILYGTTAVGLAFNKGISKQAAQKLIDEYFAQFPGIRSYMDDAIAHAREHGFVRTMFGRRVWTPDIHHKFKSRRGHAENQAVNGPIQGTAADVIKKAMIAVDGLLLNERLLRPMDTKMLLQVHDELIFEARESDVEWIMPKIVSVMEDAVQLDGIQLLVEAKAGNNWNEAH